MGNDYPQAVAAMQLYDVLLVNAIADGMNLVAKEGPIVNQRDGLLDSKQVRVVWIVALAAAILVVVTKGRLGCSDELWYAKQSHQKQEV